ncbi:hypothetical protein [Bacillus sp. M6-12]|uniref:hypothetical protein n=1 Tax=Bacillus sp. M6-12 TaxID=2054166 RepID=UPI0015E06CDF|nr:hypothetical protein [Bacillus sp. M6-12]
MNFFIMLIVLFVILYTIGFAVSLRKEKNKRGSVAVMVLAAALVVLPFLVANNLK